MTEEQAAYITTGMRVKLVKFSDVKIQGELATRIIVVWEILRNDMTWDERRRKSTQEPKTIFLKAMEGVIPEAMKLLQLPDTYANNVDVTQCKFTYDKYDTVFAEVSLRKLVSSGTVTFTSPALPNVGQYDLLQTDTYAKALDQVRYRALEYARDTTDDV